MIGFTTTPFIAPKSFLSLWDERSLILRVAVERFIRKIATLEESINDSTDCGLIPL
jgi:hypothetical protein